MSHITKMNNTNKKTLNLSDDWGTYSKKGRVSKSHVTKQNRQQLRQLKQVNRLGEDVDA